MTMVANRDAPAWRERHAGSIRQLSFLLWVFVRNPSAVLGLVLVAGFLIMALFGHYLIPYPDDVVGGMNLANRLQPPSAAHWFGTDEMGADIFSRVVAGARTSLWVGLIVVAFGACVGVPLGLFAGYFGGLAGAVIMRVTDVFLSVPTVVLALAVVAAIGPGTMNGVIALSVLWWPGYVRLAEANALSMRSAEFVESSRAIGATDARIVFVHILPNCFSSLSVKMSMDMGLAILSIASLGFVGLGAKPPAPEWGSMISTARAYMPDWWWYAFFPGLFIYLTVLGFSLLGDGIRDVLDPRSGRGS